MLKSAKRSVSKHGNSDAVSHPSRRGPRPLLCPRLRLACNHDQQARP